MGILPNTVTLSPNRLTSMSRPLSTPCLHLAAIPNQHTHLQTEDKEFYFANRSLYDYGHWFPDHCRAIPGSMESTQITVHILFRWLQDQGRLTTSTRLLLWFHNDQWMQCFSPGKGFGLHSAAIDDILATRRKPERWLLWTLATVRVFNAVFCKPNWRLN